MNRAAMSLVLAYIFLGAQPIQGDAGEPGHPAVTPRDVESEIATSEETKLLKPIRSDRKAKRLDRRMKNELALYVTDLMRRADVPGASVAIVQNGEIIYLEGFGLRELGKTQEVTPHTLMMIGSTGKSMTTMMMATLIDEGKITWETPAVAIYPNFAVRDPMLTPQITMRHMVCNCTGMARHDLEVFFATEQLTAEITIRSIASFELVGEFGRTFGYVNQMVAAGGYIAAWAAQENAADIQQNYLDQMQKRVFDPIGMKRTTFSFEEAETSSNRATPHGRTGSMYVPLALDLERLLAPIAPAGASWSNARDTALYLITQLNRGVAPNGRRMVSAKNLMATWESQVELQAGADYGLGWVIATHEGQRVLLHGGGTSGFTSELAFLPDANVGVVVLSNAQNANLFVGAVRSRILELLFEEPKRADATYTARMDDVRLRFQRKAARIEPFDAATVESHAGVYRNDELGEVSLRSNGDGLIFVAGAFASELRSMGDDTYVLWDPPLAGSLVHFSKAAEGPTEFVLDADDPDVLEEYTFVQTSVPRHHEDSIVRMNHQVGGP